MQFSIYAPATIANIGSGFEVLGLAIEGLGDTFHFDFAASKTSIKVKGSDETLVPITVTENITSKALSYFSKQPCAIEIERSIPISSGLGSSAAASVGGAFAGALIAKIDNPTEILRAALKAQTLATGYQLDNIAPCFFGGVTLVHHVHPIEILQPDWTDRYWIALYIPDFKIETHESRALLPNSLENSCWIQQMANLGAFLIGLQKGNSEILRKSLVDDFAEPQRAGIITRFYEARKLAQAHGALNLNICGSGPTCFSFFENEYKAKNTAPLVSRLLNQNATFHIGKIARQGVRLI